MTEKKSYWSILDKELGEVEKWFVVKISNAETSYNETKEQLEKELKHVQVDKQSWIKTISANEISECALKISQDTMTKIIDKCAKGIERKQWYLTSKTVIDAVKESKQDLPKFDEIWLDHLPNCFRLNRKGDVCFVGDHKWQDVFPVPPQEEAASPTQAAPGADAALSPADAASSSGVARPTNAGSSTESPGIAEMVKTNERNEDSNKKN